MIAQITGRIAEDFGVRAPTPGDAEIVADLLNTCGLAEAGQPICTADDLRSEWQSPGVDLANNYWLVFAPEGALIGYMEMWVRAPYVYLYLWGRVHPDYEGQGIGTWLLRLAEARARELVPQAPPDARLALRNGVNHRNEAARRLLEGAGYAQVRSYWRMEIELNGAPPAAVWPEGIVLRAYVPGQDERAIYDAMDEAFRDHWGYLPQPFAEWQYWMTQHGEHDPALWFLAMEGDEIAGASLCRPTLTTELGLGWVQTLGVRRPWRRRGLGLALLRHSFSALYRRGQRKVGLGVDSQNLTGATRLYEKAGMHITRQYDTYEKEIRPGRELSAESIQS